MISIARGGISVTLSYLFHIFRDVVSTPKDTMIIVPFGPNTICTTVLSSNLGTIFGWPRQEVYNVVFHVKSTCLGRYGRPGGRRGFDDKTPVLSHLGFDLRAPGLCVSDEQLKESRD